MGRQTEPGRGDDRGSLCGGSECVLDVQGMRTGWIRAHGFSACISLPWCGRWRTQRMCMRVCLLTEQVGELLCHLEMPGAAQAT